MEIISSELCVGQDLAEKKSGSVLSGFSLRWFEDIHCEMSAGHTVPYAPVCTVHMKLVAFAKSRISLYIICTLICSHTFQDK